jgi:hypothetical protein
MRLEEYGSRERRRRRRLQIILASTTRDGIGKLSAISRVLIGSLRDSFSLPGGDFAVRDQEADDVRSNLL